MEQLHIEEGLTGGTVTVSLSGDADAAGAADLRNALRRVPEGGALVVDLRRVVFMDSAGLGALICGIREIRAAGGAAALCVGRGGVRQLLTMTGFERIIATVPSLRLAHEAVGTNAGAGVTRCAV